jgi:hypothetical protein
MTYASAARLHTFPPATPAGSSPPHIADNDPSPENGCEKSPALFDALYLLAGAIAGLVVVLTLAVRS